MALKIINATELRIGGFVMINKTPCVVKKMDISKTGKHGASKCRVEAVGVLDNKKRITVMPGTQRVNVPMVDKRRAQFLNLNNGTATVMDVETYETFEVPVSDEIKEKIKERGHVEQIEYWNIEGRKIVKRLF
jgi:translation initiation factor 5A